MENSWKAIVKLRFRFENNIKHVFSILSEKATKVSLKGLKFELRN